jgi:trehalose 6-phosphate synthase
VSPSHAPTQSADLVIVANRLPVDRVDNPDGTSTWRRSPGGLVSALEPVMRANDGAWIGWPGGTDTELDPFVEDGLSLVPVALSASEVEEFYEGFSNATLWPLYHDVIGQPEYHRTWWDAYVKVNRRFADAIVSIADPDATVWVHDYQLQLVPGMLRQILPDVRIGFFFHTPFPAREIFLRLPWRTQVMRALLAADLIGFQTEVMAHNFRHTAPRAVPDAEHHGESENIVLNGHTARTRTRPIGIDYDRFANASTSSETSERVETLRTTLGHPRKVLLGVDRLDYTKGIDVRLRAFGELLDEDRISADDVVMIQVAEPSRSNVNGYAEVRAEVERQVGEINGSHGTMERPAIHYLHRSHDFDELMALYRLADVMVVTPFRDGMNLVVKEYVATRHDLTGAVVLSEFAGAAHELSQAVLVNPYDIDGLKEALEWAVVMPPDDQRIRMTSMREAVAVNSAQYWASSFIAEIEEA